MARGHAALLQIFLMVLFGAIERARGSDFGGDRPLEFAAGVQRGARLLSGGFLLRRMEENRTAILRAEVRSLAIHLSWVVSLPECIQQLFLTQYCPVEVHLHYLRGPGFIGANIFLRGVCHLSAAVASSPTNH